MRVKASSAIGGVRQLGESATAYAKRLGLMKGAASISVKTGKNPVGEKW